MNTVVSNVVHVVTDCQQLSLTQCSIQKKIWSACFQMCLKMQITKKIRRNNSLQHRSKVGSHCPPRSKLGWRVPLLPPYPCFPHLCWLPQGTKWVTAYSYSYFIEFTHQTCMKKVHDNVHKRYSDKTMLTIKTNLLKIEQAQVVWLVH